MKVFILNNGSSSVKFQLIDTDDEKVLAKGLVERIGNESVFKFELGDLVLQGPCTAPDHRAALNLVLATLTDPKCGAIESLDEIGGIGHRVVHGGERFTGAALVTPDVVDGIRECSQFAPLHNPHNLKGIEICAEEIPNRRQVAVFDTSFHAKMPKEAYLYALPMTFYEKLRIRRYGFHGTSHSYVSQKAAEILERPYSDLRIITCHLGNGCSLAAIKDGVSIDTSMGFTPLEGLVMGTRCGDIDPAIIPYLMDVLGMSSEEVTSLLNKESGLLGISGTTNDMREILSMAEGGSESHRLAFLIFCRRLKKYVGAFSAILGGVDTIVFTGGIGENSPPVREKSLEGLQYMGVVLSETRNKKNATLISRGKVKVLVVPTNEELLIARNTRDVIVAEGREIAAVAGDS